MSYKLILLLLLFVQTVHALEDIKQIGYNNLIKTNGEKRLIIELKNINEEVLKRWDLEVNASKYYVEFTIPPNLENGKYILDEYHVYDEVSIVQSSQMVELKNKRYFFLFEYLKSILRYWGIIK